MVKKINNSIIGQSLRKIFLFTLNSSDDSRQITENNKSIVNILKITILLKSILVG